MRRILRASFLLLFFLPGVALAGLQITRVEYDLPGSDSGREWIEITNKGTDTVDISGFRLLEGGVKHKLILAQGSWLLASGGSAVIADDSATFLSEHPGFAKSLYTSSFSLSNTGETLSLVTASGAVESSLTYKADPPQKAPAKTTSKTSVKSKTSSSSLKQSAAVAEVPVSTFSTSESGGSSPLPAMLPWYLGLGAVVGVGIVGVFFARSRDQKELETKGISEEFEIE